MALELDELEDHLRARIDLELQLNPTLAPARAFRVARDELGEPAAVSREFAKAGKPRWRRLLVAGWVLFGASFLLPAFFVPGTGLGLSRPFGIQPYYGFEIFWKLILLPVDGKLAGLLAAVIPNLALVLTLPAFLGTPGGQRRWLRWAVTMVGLGTLAMAVLMPPVAVSVNGELAFAQHIGIGFWAWSLSFVCAASALWLRDRGRAMAKVEESTA